MHHNGNRGDNCIQEGRGQKEYRMVYRILAWAWSYSFGGSKDKLIRGWEEKFDF